MAAVARAQAEGYRIRPHAFARRDETGTTSICPLTAVLAASPAHAPLIAAWLRDGDLGHDLVAAAARVLGTSFGWCDGFWRGFDGVAMHPAMCREDESLPESTDYEAGWHAGQQVRSAVLKEGDDAGMDPRRT
ncbi:MAG TPA: hypothetical protein VNI83_04105 [Vicinamibacterales bacterium]|nr:hypothetical protein [Vicinamibacterales bacterium]